MTPDNHDVFSRPVSRWMEGRGPDADVVISSLVRLARNFAGVPFTLRMTKDQAQRLIDQVAAPISQAHESGGEGPLGDLRLVRLGDLGRLQRQVLVEKHLISPQHAQDPNGAVAIRADQAMSLMINEEDHLRIQVICAALRLSEAFALCTAVDDALEESLDYAWDERYGYLTACPTNTGTAMRASVMLHLPGLVMTNQAGRLAGLIGKLNCVVRGMYGEGSEAAGNIFQVSNQITMGHTEDEVLTGLVSLTTRLIQDEREARASLLAEMRPHLEDRVWRAWGTLTCARVLSSREALKCISDLKLGADLAIIKGLDGSVINSIMFTIRPAFLQLLHGEKLAPEERDMRRASLVRRQLAGAPPIKSDTADKQRPGQQPAGSGQRGGDDER